MRRAEPEVKPGGEQDTQSSPEQREPLLRTKLYVPPVRPNRVNRPRLVELVNSGLDKPLILISAPAGYGKTTLVSGWLSGEAMPSTWLSLDEGDNDPICFLQNFIAALRKIMPALQPGLLSALQGIHPTPYATLLDILINEIAECASSFVFVLDDFHTIHRQPVLDLVTSLLDHAPPKMHLLLISRSDPPLPLIRLRARGQMVEIRAEQLRFTREEIAAFFNEAMGLRLSGEDIAALETRTEGWIAGLQLAALSMQSSKDIRGFVSEFTGSHYYIVDYLTEEVLKLQPEKVRTFLLQSSILTSMCASLCAAVIEDQDTPAGDGGGAISPIHDSQDILEYLDRSNLFVVSLDARRQWYRYHHLFADVLNIRLERLFPGQLPNLHRRASQWYEQNGIISEATDHALKAKDHARAAQLVVQHGCSLLMRGESFTLLKWVEAVEPYAHSHPWLAILKAWAHALTGHLEEVEPALQAANQLISYPEPTLEVKIMLGSMAAVRAYLANLQGDARLALDHAQNALEYLPEGNAFSCSMRSVTVSILGDASWMNGNLSEARRAYLEATQISRAAGNIYMTIITNTNLADVLVEQGELHQAARLYSEALQMASRPDGQKLPLADRIYAGLSKVTYEWNQLETAAEHVLQCIELCRQRGDASLLAKSYVRLAQLERARGNQQKALEAIHAAEDMASEKRLVARQSAWVKYACARWWIAEGDLDRAVHLIQDSGITIDSILPGAEIPLQQEAEYIILIRLWLAQGNFDAALSLSERLLLLAEAAGRIGRVLEILILQALALQGKKEIDRALIVLEKALSMAQLEMYVRTFLDEGGPMAKMLYQAKSHRLSGSYASELLSAPGRVSGTELPPAQSLVEPLTLRELEVLDLIQAGHSNTAIADRLVISLPTVKRHISNIYAKLGAKSRTQAVARGKELGFFDG